MVSRLFVGLELEVGSQIISRPRSCLSTAGILYLICCTNNALGAPGHKFSDARVLGRLRLHRLSVKHIHSHLIYHPSSA